MRKVICSFANKSFSQALKRLELQINIISFFDECYLYNEDDLGADFKNKYKDILIEGTRGYGFWSWKPYIINKILDKLDEGDSLLYIDAGCHINYKGKGRLLQYFDLLEKSKTGILTFQLPPDEISFGFFKKKLVKKNYHLQRNWTKGDLLDYFDVRQNREVTNTPQILAGVIFIKKCEKSIEILNQWMEVFSHNMKLIDDSKSETVNLEGFIQNRHDQSAFSIICKICKVDTLSANEIQQEQAIVNNNPILALRDIGSRMPYKSFKLLRLTRILKSPYLFFNWNRNTKPKLLNRN